MRVGITGSTGLIGTALSKSLRGDGHTVVPFLRPSTASSSAGPSVAWDPASDRLEPEDLAGLDAVVHLAGVGIGDARWTEDRKAQILESRVAGTTLLAEAFRASSTPPPVLLSGSAVGYYGSRGDEILTETSTPGDDFAASVCVAWEAAAGSVVASPDTRVAFLRTGIVQSAHGGPLAKQLPLFKLGLGGRIGSGRQYLSWVSITDEVRAIRFLLDHDVDGPVNLVAPEPVTNAAYAKALGSVLNRPTFAAVPGFAPKALLGGELVDTLLLASQRCRPEVLIDAGFEFDEPEVRGALAALLG